MSFLPLVGHPLPRLIAATAHCRALLCRRWATRHLFASGPTRSDLHAHLRCRSPCRSSHRRRRPHRCWMGRQPTDRAGRGRLSHRPGGTRVDAPRCTGPRRQGHRFSWRTSSGRGIRRACSGAVTGPLEQATERHGESAKQQSRRVSEPPLRPRASPHPSAEALLVLREIGYGCGAIASGVIQ